MKERVIIMDAKQEEKEEDIEKLAAYFVSEDKNLSIEEAREKAKAILE